MITSILASEFHFKTSRSSGPGGQHVNKVSSRVSLFFNVQASNGLTPEEKERIFLKLASKINNEHELVLHCETSRSQHKNKELVIKKCFETLETALKKDKPRRATKPTRSSVAKRLDHKKKQSSKKENRRKPEF